MITNHIFRAKSTSTTTEDEIAISHDFEGTSQNSNETQFAPEVGEFQPFIFWPTMSDLILLFQIYLLDLLKHLVMTNIYENNMKNLGIQSSLQNP